MSFQTVQKNFAIGINLVPNTPAQKNTKLGDLEVFGTNLYFHNGTINDIIVRALATQTLSNKTLLAPTVVEALITAEQLDVIDGNPLRLFENTANGTESISLKAPGSVPTSYDIIFPQNAPSGAKFLQHTNNGQLIWVDGTPPPTPNVVLSVTGLNTNNTDPQNPVVRVSVDGTTITGSGTPGDPLVGSPSGITDLTGDVTATGPGSVAATLVNIGAGVTTTLGSDATGDIYYRNSSGELDRLAIGSDGDVLAVSSGLPSWQSSSITAGNLIVNRFSGDGSQTNFTLTASPGSVNNAQIYITGVCQNKNTYTIVGTALTFSEAPPSGTNNIEVVIGSSLPIGTPSDGTVTEPKIATDAVTTVKILDGNVTPAKLSQPITLGTAISTTSGSTHEFTSLPSWVKKITLIFNGVSLNGTSSILVQLGTSSSYETSAYAGSGVIASTSGTISGGNPTTGFSVFLGGSASNIVYGSLTLFLVNPSTNTWVASGAYGYNVSYTGTTGGSKTLSGTLTRVRITSLNGTDAFDAGSVNILYE